MSENVLPPSVVPLLKAGELFEGKYRLLRLVGQGSFASVVHARHEAMDRDVALKFLRPDVLKSHPEVGERFLREVRLASRLSNPRTVTIFDFGETDEEIPYMVLEYVDGRPLDYALEKYGALGLKRSIRLTLQILESLDEAHDHRIIHRDLKPANIMVAKRGGKKGVDVKVLDFGVAKLVEQSEDGIKSESGRQSTQFIGTPRYMSPEQILGEEVSAASDLYSLGLIFYEMCTGEESVPNENVAKVAQLHLSEEPLDLASIDSVPAPLRKVIRKATERHASHRYQEAAQFREALEDALEIGRSRHRSAKSVASATGSPGDDESALQKEERPSGVFSGQGYLAPPDDEELAKAVSTTGPGVADNGARPGKRGSSSGGADRPPTPGAKKQRRPRSSKGKAEHSGGERRAPSPVASVDSKGELELDAESLRAHQRERTERRRAMQKRQLEQRRQQSLLFGPLFWKGLLASVGIATAGALGFIIVGGALELMAWPMRFGFALLPVGLALLWVLFSPSSYPDFMRRVMVPFARRAWASVALSLVVLTLVMPAEAAQSLRGDGLWFMAGWPEGVQTGVFASITQSICNTAAWVMEFVSAVVPWSN